MSSCVVGVVTVAPAVHEQKNIGETHLVSLFFYYKFHNMFNSTHTTFLSFLTLLCGDLSKEHVCITS